MAKEAARRLDRAGRELLDGLSLTFGVRFLGKARHALASAGYEYADGFELADWPAATRKMLALRTRLRLRTARA